MVFSVRFATVTPSEQYCPSLKTLKSVQHLELWAQRESSVHGHLVCFNEHEETGLDVDHGLMITVSVFILSLLISKASFWFRSALLISSWSCRLYSPHELLFFGTYIFGNRESKIRQTRKNCTLAWDHCYTVRHHSISWLYACECGLSSDHDLLCGVLVNDLWIRDLLFKIGHDRNSLIWYHVGRGEQCRYILSESFNANLYGHLDNGIAIG